MASPHGTIIPPFYCTLKFPDDVNIADEIIDLDGNKWAVDNERWLTFNGDVCEKTQTPIQWVLYFNDIVYTHCDPIDGFIVQWFIWKDGKPVIPGCYRMVNHASELGPNHQDHCIAHGYLKRLVRGTEFRLRGMHGEM